jgi:hypothetical protein
MSVSGISAPKIPAIPHMGYDYPTVEKNLSKPSLRQLLIDRVVEMK